MDRELVEVEQPFSAQLGSMGWTHLVGSKWDPTVSERESFREVFLVGRLRDAIRRINLDPDGEPWLDDDRISQAASALTAGPAGQKLIEANQEVTELLLSGTTVAGLDGWDGGRDRTINYIDFEHPERNDFVVVSQFRVDEPGGQAKKCIVPDLVLFVNGIPLVVVECKAWGPEDAMATAIGQLRRYANQRPEVEQPEGNEQLFWTNQFVVATTGLHARVGTITAGPEHFLEWKDTAPVDKAEVAASLGKPPDQLTGQELLVAGMLRPEILLDLVRHFTVFDVDGPRTVKKVARYQQYRAVVRALDRLRNGATRAEDGEFDRRGGLIWHTQGSGKSLTMVFLVRAMRSDPALRRFKVVVVTDRTDLQHQLRSTAELVGETVQVAQTSAKVKELLAQPGPAIVMAMIQKYRDTSPTGEGEVEEFPVLNEDEAIVVLVDEAHRSHGSTMHANLLGALPNAARIGFTGTPIIMGAKKKTHEIFGSFIDRYTLTESEADESTVPILYEGRTAEGAVKGASGLDEVFFRWFAGLSDDERDTLQRKYAGVAEVLESPELIGAKARDMLRHYVETVMPQRFKAMVVATSRLACVRYRDAFLAARDELVAEIDALSPELKALEGDAIDDLPVPEQFLVRALPHLELLQELDFVPVISGDHNDDPAWSLWTDDIRQRVHINQFKMPLRAVDDGGDPTAFVIVKSMLLTGFDAPVAQVLYLDRLIREAELLQAIARVNRTADGKDYGLVVDYYGVAAHLTEALAAYTSDDLEGTLRSLNDEIERLDSRHQRVRQLFVQRGVEPGPSDAAMEACVDLLADEALRAQFDVDLNRLLNTLDVVLPRPEARPFIADAKLFADIQRRLRQRYRDQGDGGFDPSLYRAKVRQLVDEHITVLDLAQKIPPVRITDLDFAAKVQALPSPRAKASEMEHAARHHIRTHLDEDPVRYQKLSERLDEILERLGEQWEQLVLELQGFVTELAAPPPDDGTGLDATERPFHGILADALPDADAGQAAELVTLSREIVAKARAEVRTVGFWSNGYRQDQLRRWIKIHLDQTDLWSLPACDQLAAQLVELARANNHRLVAS
jgi:type I restriction enzyme R subunit